MRRRDFIALAGAAAAFPRVGFAQQTKVPRVAYVSIAQSPETLGAFHQGLADYGWTDGKNITVQFFTAPTNNDLPAFAKQAVASKPDVIFVFGATAAQAARAATTTIPVVFANTSNPLGIGLVSSLGHPGGNLTGTSLFEPEVASKQVGIMRELMPDLERIAVLYDQQFPASRDIVERAAATARSLGIEPITITIDEGKDLAAQLERIVAEKADAVYLPTGTYFGNNYTLLRDFQLKSKLPIMSSGTTAGRDPPFVGVVSYGPVSTAATRRAASFVDAILKGAKPADLPVEAPSAFDFGVNLSVAKALGIAVPTSILVQATQVVE